MSRVRSVSRPALLAASLLLGASLPALFAPAHALSLTEKTALQVAMQQHVDRQTVEGSYLFFDRETQSVSSLAPVAAHPMILTMGEHYILCFDFLDAAGEKVELDYYLARKGESFVVFHEAIAQRDVVRAMMQAGKVKPAE